MHSIRTKTHHLLDIVLDTLFELDVFNDCAGPGGTVNDMAAAHIYPHAFIATCGNGMDERDRGIVRDGVQFALGIMQENIEGLEVEDGADEALTNELFDRLMAYQRYEYGVDGVVEGKKGFESPASVLRSIDKSTN